MKKASPETLEKEGRWLQSERKKAGLSAQQLVNALREKTSGEVDLTSFAIYAFEHARARMKKEYIVLLSEIFGQNPQPSIVKPIQSSAGKIQEPHHTESPATIQAVDSHTRLLATNAEYRKKYWKWLDSLDSPYQTYMPPHPLDPLG